MISGFTDVETRACGASPPSGSGCKSEVVATARRAYELSERDCATARSTSSRAEHATDAVTAEDHLVLVRLTRVQAIVSLFQALGGGWLPKPVVTVDARWAAQT